MISRKEVAERRRRINLALDWTARHRPSGTPEEGAALLLMVLAAWGDEPSSLDEESESSGAGSFGSNEDGAETVLRAGHHVRQKK